MKKDVSFEEALYQLEEIIKAMEEGNLSLADSIKKYKEGLELSDHCNKILEEVEKEIIIIK